MQIKKQIHNNFTWIDIQNPENEELSKVLTENNLPVKLVEDIMNPSLRAKTEFLKNENLIYLTLHFPLKKEDEFEKIEIDFIIKNDLILTSHYSEIDFLDKFIESIINFHIEKKSLGFSHGGAYFAYFIRHMYKNMEVSIDLVAESIKNIEDSIFVQGDERKTIEEISIARRKLFDFESSIMLHKDILESYLTTSSNLFGSEYAVYTESIMNDYLKIWHTIEHQKNMLLDLKDTNDFLLNHKTNQMIKSFTVLSFVVLPLTLLSGFFGMNTIFPDSLVKNPYGTVQIAIFMTAISISVLIYLHIKKWL